ncbi:MAG TPA: hypothetical protein VHE81_15820 [Lacipirellulaceae bacterium]|nr:hypothetical protein [Lacipirellulaceae bacterium]
MLHRVLTAGFMCVLFAPAAAADTLDAQLFPLTGEIRFHNPNATDVSFVFYSISSISGQSGALNPTRPPWQTISDTYDASGSGFIDPTNDWLIFSATSTELTEAVVPDPGGSLAPHRSVSLGQIWNPAVVPWTDLAIDVEQQSQAVNVNIQLALDGDYDQSGIVDSNDYTVWRQNLGSTSQLDADGNIDGIVDAADYAIWRKNVGNFLPNNGSSSSLGTVQSLPLFSGAVPEPSAAFLLLMAIMAIAFRPRVHRAAA